MTADSESGLSLYKFSTPENSATQSISLVESYSCEELQIKDNRTCRITDLSYSHSEQRLYVLDSQSGIIEYQMKENGKDRHLLEMQQYVTKSTGCEVFDYVSRDLFVLVCELEIPSYIVEVVRVRD